MWNPSDWQFNIYNRRIFTILSVYCLKSAAATIAAANNNNNNKPLIIIIIKM
jgi:hypothetical protein